MGQTEEKDCRSGPRLPVLARILEVYHSGDRTEVRCPECGAWLMDILEAPDEPVVEEILCPNRSRCRDARGRRRKYRLVIARGTRE